MKIQNVLFYGITKVQRTEKDAIAKILASLRALNETGNWKQSKEYLSWKKSENIVADLIFYKLLAATCRTNALIC